MKNTFHHQLIIPVKFAPVFLENAPVISKYDTNLINEEFLNWLETLNLEISGSELFHLKPNSDENPDSLPIHLDTGGFDNHIKLNFVYCNTPSKMNWFTCNDTSKLQVLKTPTGTEYTLANADDCELVHSAQIGQPSLVNAGMLHSISPVESERYCFSFTLIKHGNIVVWEQAEEIFKNYVSLM